MTYDPEILALSNVYEALQGLNRSQVKRVLEWVNSRFITDGPGEGVMVVPAAREQEQKVPEMAVSEPVKRRRGRQPKPKAAVERKPRGRKPKLEKEKKPRGRKPKAALAQELPPAEPESVVIPEGKTSPHLHVVIQKPEGFLAYDTLAEVFKGIRLKTTPLKILVAASFLQEAKNFKEMTSYDVTSALKRIGQTVGNASLAINGMINKKPPLLLQTGKMSPGKLARRQFRVTEEGLAKARECLKK